MKRSELIKRLMEHLPDEDIEVCVNNSDIIHVECLPAWYDGYLQVLSRNGNPGYNVKGLKFTGKGDKLVIVPYSFVELIEYDPEAPIEFEGISEKSVAYYKNVLIEPIRIETRELYSKSKADSSEKE